MILIITAVLLAAAALAVFVDWRNALHASLLIGVLQDPLRKLTPEQPVYFNALVVGVFGLACLSALSSNVSLAPQRIAGWRRYLARPFALFVGLIVVQAANGYLQTENIIVVFIGLLSYLTPFPAIMLAYQWALRNELGAISRFLWGYVIFVGPALLTIYLQFLGLKWDIMGEVGIGIRMYQSQFVLEANSGIFRASEVAAWHVGTCVSVILMMLFAKRRSAVYFAVAIAACCVLVWMGMLTGRRKSLAEIALFLSSFIFMLLVFKRGAMKFAIATVLIGLSLYMVAFGILRDDEIDAVAATTKENAYMARSTTVFGDMADRFDMLGIAPIFWAFQQTGIAGAGVGYGSQGAAQFGGSIQGAAEGGLGKITLELGLPGLLLAGWMTLAFVRHLWWCCRHVTTIGPQLIYLTCGCIAILVANAATFAVASQVFGDILVLLMLGTFLGFALAMPVLASREAARSEKVASKGPRIPSQPRSSLSAGPTSQGARAR